MSTSVKSRQSHGNSDPPSEYYDFLKTNYLANGRNPEEVKALESYKWPDVTGEFSKGVYLPIFSIHNPAVENTPVFASCFPLSPVAVHVNEQLHRFQIEMDDSDGIKARNQIGESVAGVHIRWTPIPHNFAARYVPKGAPYPPPTMLNPFKSQRFTMLDGEFRFDDTDKSGFNGFGAGHTVPVTVDGQSRLRIGAVVNILEGLNGLKDQQGTVAVNGFIRPPQELALNMMVRLMNPSGKFKVDKPLKEPPRPPKDAPPEDATFLTFLGEVDKPISFTWTNDGQAEATLVQRLKLISLDFSAPFRGYNKLGNEVGTLTARIRFNPFAGLYSLFTTTETTFEFDDGSTVKADMVEGRAIRDELPEVGTFTDKPLPVYRVAGFGPLISGTGQFKGLGGMMSANGVLSLYPGTASSLYVFRIFDPDGKYRPPSKLSSAKQ